MTTPFVSFHLGPAPNCAGLGATDDPGCGWLDWPDAERSSDDGVPLAVRRVLANALSRVGSVTFIVREAYPGMRVSEVSQGIVSKLFGRKLRQGTTREPAAIEQLFEDPLQAWWLGSAAAVVTVSGQMPSLEVRDWKALGGDDWVKVAKGRPEIGAVLRSGTDGEMAGWWSRTSDLRDEFTIAIEEASRHI